MVNKSKQHRNNEERQNISIKTFVCFSYNHRPFCISIQFPDPASFFHSDAWKSNATSKFHDESSVVMHTRSLGRRRSFSRSVNDWKG